MTWLDELDLFSPLSSAVEREPRKCRHFRQKRLALGGGAWMCDKELGGCGLIVGAEKARRGKNNRARGNAIEREVAAKLGLRRTGQYGGPDDAAGEWLVVQVKSGGSFPERIWRWLQALPSNAAQTRAVVVTDAPGPGHRRRSLVIVDLEDWAALHGDSPTTTRDRLLHPQDEGYAEVMAQWPVDHAEGKE